MFSIIVRLIYALTYFSFMSLVLECLNICKNWGNINIYLSPNIFEGIEAFCVIHYPILLFLLQLWASKVIIRAAKTNIVQTQLRVLKSANVGMDSLLFLGQLVPVLTLFEKVTSANFTLLLFAVLIFVLMLFLISYGAFDLSLFFLGYHQYKVSTNSSEYWLISKRRIRDFSQSFTVVEISDKILLRI